MLKTPSPSYGFAYAAKPSDCHGLCRSLFHHGVSIVWGDPFYMSVVTDLMVICLRALNAFPASLSLNPEDTASVCRTKRRQLLQMAVSTRINRSICGDFPRSPRQNSAQTSVAVTVLGLGTPRSRHLRSLITMTAQLVDCAVAS